MARKPNNPRLPNGYGSIRRITGKTVKYGVYPPQLEEDIDGRRLPVKALCYVPSWSVGFAVLTAYKAGTYAPGLERELIDLDREKPATAADMGVIKRIIEDYTRLRRELLNQPEEAETFSEVYEKWFADKFDGSTLSKQSRASVAAAFGNCSDLHQRPITSITLDELQGMIDSCSLGESSVRNILSLLNGVYAYAEVREICPKNLASFVRLKSARPSEHGVAFTEQELRVLWEHRDDPTIEFAVIMCYAGYRISAYKTMQIDLAARSFAGGNKTAAGKSVVTPIHSVIYPLVMRRLRAYGEILPVSPEAYRKSLYEALSGLGIEKHTPHDCKHTFSALCERYGVAENDRKRLLGHRIGNVTNDVYGHRTLEDLRAQIEKIPSPEAFESLSKAGQGFPASA